MKLGAVDFIEKPFSEQALLGCFNQAFDLLEQRAAAGKRRREAQRARRHAHRAREARCWPACSPAIPTSRSPRRSAFQLRTVEMHRGNMMDRLQASSLAEALTLALDAGIAPAPDQLD